MSSKISIKLNNQEHHVPAQSTIIQVADEAGVYIPRFCYHKKLSIAANCRMCLVEVEGAPKPMPACSTPVMPNMQIWTRSTKTKTAQRAVMEFLLINHPLDCPVCDQGGQCELQDLAMRYGNAHSEFEEAKRSVANDDLGPLIGTEMTRCIHCTRCVRFGSEIAGKMELGAMERGETMKITTYIKQQLRSELSGNVIDLCPVGALVSKPFQSRARAWELSQRPSIASHDCLGSNVYVHTYRQKVMRVVPRENDTINETWLSDRDRYAYLGLEHKDRLVEPMIKIGGNWRTTDWPTALGQAARCLQTTLKKHGPKQLGGLITPNATVEELYLFQTLCRALGSPHIDHRIREIDNRDQSSLPVFPKAELSINELETCDLVILVGSNIQREQPLLMPRLRKVIAQGGSVISINCVDYDFNFEVLYKTVVPPDQILTQVATLARHCGASLSNAGILVAPDPILVSIAQKLNAAKKAAILVGALVHHHPQATNLRYWIEKLADSSKASEIYLTEGANSIGAWLTGAVPHRALGAKPLPSQEIGLPSHAIFSNKLAAYLLFGLEPSLDCANPMQVGNALENAECVIAMTAFKSDFLTKNAHVLLPIAPFAENSGSCININRDWQYFESIVPPVKNARPGWEVLQALSKILQVCNVEYFDLTALRAALEPVILPILNQSPEKKALSREPALLDVYVFSHQNKNSLMRITEWSLYSSDDLVRHAMALQQSTSCEVTGAYINSALAKHLGLKPYQQIKLVQDSNISDSIPVFINDRVLNGCVWTPAGRPEIAKLGASFGPIGIVIN